MHGHSRFGCKVRLRHGRLTAISRRGSGRLYSFAATLIAASASGASTVPISLALAEAR